MKEKLEELSKHYTVDAISPLDVIKSNFTAEELRGFYVGNILKYTMRAGNKGDRHDDYLKAYSYMLMLLQLEEDE